MVGVEWTGIGTAVSTFHTDEQNSVEMVVERGHVNFWSSAETSGNNRDVYPVQKKYPWQILAEKSHYV